MKKVVLFLLLPFLNWAQSIDTVQFKSATGSVTFFPDTESIEGEIAYTFEILKNTNRIFLDGKNMQVSLAPDSKFRPEISSSSKKIYFSHPFKSGKEYNVKFRYKVEHPKQAIYFLNHSDAQHNQIWSQGQGKENSHWLPISEDLNQKTVFDLTYIVPEGYRAIGNGILKQQETENQKTSWRYQLKHPISNYLVAVAVGKFDQRDKRSKNGLPLELYLPLSERSKFEYTYKKSVEIFDFLEEEIGVAFPFENYKQVPVRDFLYAGMENAGLTFFSENFITDSIGFNDRNYINVNAHELAHQWFGNLVTAQSSKDHWLHEGFASYYALLAEKHINGEDDFYFALYQSAERLKAESEQGKGQSLLNPKASSLTFYEKGAWALFILHDLMGVVNFKKGIQNFLNHYAYQNAGIDDFIEKMEEAGGKDLSFFVRDWLEQSAFQDDQALQLLKKSDFMQAYLTLAGLRTTPLKDKFEQLNRALDFPVNKYLGQEAVYQLASENSSSPAQLLYKKALQTNNLYVRQAVAESLQHIPTELQTAYETLLNDASYLTQEKALLHLWQSFPENRIRYLDQTKDIQGFYDKNMRTLWLTLSIVTQDFENENKEAYFQELASYGSAEYDYSIRQNAFGYLYQINRFTRQNYLELLQATSHPAWQFKNFAKSLLVELAKEESHKTELEQLKSELSEKEAEVLEDILSR